MVRKRLGSVLVLLVGATLAAMAACGTDAVGIETCRQIETARCQNAPSCPDINLGLPVPSGNGVDACIRFYKDACLHGLATNDPGAPQTKACVDAINAAGQAKTCDVVYHPENAPACAWLIPPQTPVDAGTDADAAIAADSAAALDAAPEADIPDVFGALGF